MPLGRKVVILGALVMATGMALILLSLDRYGTDIAPWQLSLGLVVAGLGMAMVAGTLLTIVLAKVPEAEAGAASALINTSIQVGVAAERRVGRDRLLRPTRRRARRGGIRGDRDGRGDRALSLGRGPGAGPSTRRRPQDTRPHPACSSGAPGLTGRCHRSTHRCRGGDGPCRVGVSRCRGSALATCPTWAPPSESVRAAEEECSSSVDHHFEVR
ncbi:hypothetical protein ACU686_12575 [Yinghuangia aomiensis]